MRVYVVTDMEGLCGVTEWSQVMIDHNSSLYQESRRLLTEEVNACVAGCMAGGATEVHVLDGHGGGFNFIPELLHPDGIYITGPNRPTPGAGLDDNFDCGILLAFHAMNGVQDAVLHHTQSHIGELKYWYNGVESGELAQSSLIMGHYNIPVVMATGDKRLCEEARRFLGEEIVTIQVKDGLSRTSCLTLSPLKARQLIHDGAKEAMGRVSRCKPYKTDLPICGRLQSVDPAFINRIIANGLSTKIDDFTVEREIPDATGIYYF